MDNKIFNVNGRTKKQLALAVQLLLLTEYSDNQKVRGWYYSKQKGLILTWHVSEQVTPFTDRMGKESEIVGDELVDLLWTWLNTPEARDVECVDWDENLDHDGSNEKGWRLYVDEWGHVKSGSSLDHYSIAAFKPVYLWYGK